MKKRFILFFFLQLIVFSPAHSEELAFFYEDVLNTSHNIIPKGETPPSPQQVCLVCHINEEIQGYLEPTLQTPPELAAIFEHPSQKETGSAKALWNLSDNKISYVSIRSGALKKEPSTFCLSCHDGVIGSDIHGLKQADGKFLDHPVNIAYPREPNGHFVPALPLPTELRYWSIPDQNGQGIIVPTGPTSEYYSKQIPAVFAIRTAYGKVNCGSCHNPHTSKISAYLRESPRTLCLICHMR